MSDFIHKYIRSALSICIFLFTSSAAGFNNKQWIQVLGGSWKPDNTVLIKADAKLKIKFQSHIKYRRQWKDYTFQYQGNILPTGEKIININGFCSIIQKDWIAHFKLTSEWIPIFGGGSCVFHANYNSTKDEIFDLKINAPK